MVIIFYFVNDFIDTICLLASWDIKLNEKEMLWKFVIAVFCVLDIILFYAF